MTNRLEPDVYRRTAKPLLAGPRRQVQHSRLFVALMVVSLGLLVANKLDLPAVGVIRGAIQDGASVILRSATAVTAPVVSFGHQLADWRTLSDERNRLREENDRLKGWQARAQRLEQQAVALAQLAHVVGEHPAEFLTARVISGNGGPFVRVALLDAGREQGVKAGNPAMSAQGLVGRVVASGRISARLLLLTDFNSRVPVVIGSDAARAVMQGDNSPLPKIAYLPPGAQIKPGDDVFTSGVGGLFPRGLRVGVVVDTGDVLRIEPAARLDRLDYVSVLLMDTLSAALAEEEQQSEAKAKPSLRFGAGWPSSAEGGIGR